MVFFSLYDSYGVLENLGGSGKGVLCFTVLLYFENQRPAFGLVKRMHDCKSLHFLPVTGNKQ